MADNLVIVESPAKAKTIQRYLGNDYEVLASYGHIRDLPRSDFAIEVEQAGGCHLTYIVPDGSKKHVSALRKAAKEATVWLAPDLDREGEAIAWHIADELGLDVETTHRVTFDSITKEAIQEAFAAPRTLNLDLVDAQQARRAVDRIVGYRLSPVLWRTVSSGISAGRVQSVALRIIVDRENEIRAFDPQEYWDFDATMADAEDATDTYDARLYAVGDRRIAKPQDIEKHEGNDKKLAELLLVGDQEAADDIVERATGRDYHVAEVRRTEAKQRPKAPFTTSTLQQDAANRLGFSAARTMRVAQQLYEGMRIEGEEVGLITYMRTDSVNLSSQAVGEITSLVDEKFGDRYTLAKPRQYSGKTKGAQEAHEAIRPTSAFRSPDRVASQLSTDQLRLYDLIWKRTVATQMADAIKDRVSADVVDAEQEFTFRITGQVLKFDGFIKVYTNWRDPDAEDDERDADSLPEITEGQALDLAELLANQHFTTPPPRFTEATLVKTLEAEGIGRPSTYASIIQTLVNREYVRLESRRFFPTPLGEVVTVFLKNHFTEVVDVNFTSRMEETLDEIAAGDEQWCRTVTRFLDEVDTWVDERKPERPRTPLVEPADCPVCGSPMERVFSGKSKQWFASCSRWPDCDGTLPLNDDGTVGEPEPEPEPDPNVVCPEDGGLMIPREGKYGLFYGCQNYPKCKGILNVQNRAVYMDRQGDADGEVKAFRSPTDPGSFMELRRSRYGKPFLGSTGYPDDQFAVWSVPLSHPCPECGAPLRKPPKNRKVPTVICAGPELEHVFEADDFELPTVTTMEVVPGIEAYDPELGGTPLSEPEEYPPMPSLTYVDEQKPKKKKGKAKKKAAPKKKASKKKS
ncbi:type I DNA topoisomerase [Salsipaludibacter albus]|uniref:type I DNA topoisomerase n=1 Tax=Salsipaludibacter albus TaxID=2849650 RepID=UPI001EE3C2A3|nr:type I DNA topoisomerase [Salsipaludibacter albus]